MCDCMQAWCPSCMGVLGDERSELNAAHGPDVTRERRASATAQPPPDFAREREIRQSLKVAGPYTIRNNEIILLRQLAKARDGLREALRALSDISAGNLSPSGHLARAALTKLLLLLPPEE